MQPEEYIKRMTELSQKKYALLKEMLLFTKSQTAAIADENMKNLERLIQNKQERIEGIDKLDDEFKSCFMQLKQALNVDKLDEIKDMKISGVKELQDVIGQITEILKEISEIEKKNSDEIKKKMAATAVEIKKINQSKTINSAYKSSPQSMVPSYFIDKKR
ncbi:MAG TPA: flagellar protein FlgN [Clostridiaceae bacterium]|nr:flagellar protein FlgN [Clostridiaceae bacterium]